jgi:glycosyltransferase involved in cell wall biosynthesis
MINRSDAYEMVGGDTVQMEKTRQALQERGLVVDVSLAGDVDIASRNYDLVHLFNLQTAEESWQVCQEVKEQGLPVVMSTIYWEPLQAWFWTTPDKRFAWRWVRWILGHRLGYWLYATWRRTGYPSQRHWQVQRQLLLAADALLPNSRAEANQLMRVFRLERDILSKIAVVPNAIDRRLFDPSPVPSRGVQGLRGVEDFVLQVSRLAPEKNPLGLMEALWDVEIPIAFVGNPSPYYSDYFEICRERAAQRGNVHFVGWMPHHSLPGVYVRAAVHALPSWRETPGLASLEAAAAGCRVVSTSVGSAMEYFGDGAWYCHPAHRSSIKRAIVEALKAPCSEKLRERVLTRFTWEAAAEATLSGYQAVLRE